jgi:putative ABC transport system permease protein
VGGKHRLDVHGSKQALELDCRNFLAPQLAEGPAQGHGRARFLGSIGAVSLFVATVGIVNTMYVSVMERTREIGILKAIGYRPKQIMGMFLSEAALTGVIGGVCGLLLGYILSFLMGGLLGGATVFGGFRGPGGGGGGGLAIQPVFSTELIAFSLIFPVILAIFAGLYPAWRASRMNAVAALKYE